MWYVHSVAIKENIYVLGYTFTNLEIMECLNQVSVEQIGVKL